MLCLFNFSDDGLRYLEHFIDITNRQGHINDIHNMFIIPSCIFTNASDIENNTFYFFKNGTLTQQNMIKTSYGIVSYMSQNREISFFQNVEMTRPVALNNFVPKNNKVLCYPFNYIMVSNQVGEQNIYKIEDFAPVEGFANNEIVFQIQMALSVGMSCRIVPINYKNVNFNYDECLSLAKFPTCSWSGDAYTNWLTKEGVNGNKVVTTAAALGLAALTGNIVGAAISTAGQFISAYGQFKKAQLLPEITGGQNTADVNFAHGNNNFTIRQFHAKNEFLQQVDDYFSKFGYKTLKIKAPNITGRTNWNYVQIGNDEIVGISNYHNSISVPTSDMEKINQIFRTGTTCWHNHANLGNFSLSNTIV